jgi:hypothetical protein
VSDKRLHRAALAPNWRGVLAVDAGIGLVVFTAGVVLMTTWNVVAGAFVGSVGLTYVVAVAYRYRDWRRARIEAGLDG